MYGNVVTRVGPPSEPIHLDEAKLHCRVELDFTADDALIGALITAARSQVEASTTRRLVTRGLRATMSGFPCEIELQSPARKVTSVSYLDEAGATQTVDSDDYVVDLATLPAIIINAFEAIWPVTYEHPAAVTVDYITGHGTKFTADQSTETLTAANHPFADGDPVQVFNSGGALPTGLSAGSTYYVINSADGALKLSATVAGSAVNLTGNGTGNNFLLRPDDSAWVAMRQAMLLLIGNWYNNRESTNVGNIVSEMPFGVQALLAPHKIWGV